uniref:Family with sequence similarity 187 member A n=1 Tax=Lepisosteus oculatus TaxID=7918 RepID=W5N3H2_LEPOC
ATLFSVVFLLGMPLHLSAYEAVQEEETIFAKKPCPAFLVFDNTAYLADMTIELPCSCKPEGVSSVVWYYQKHLGGEDAAALTDHNGTKVVDAAEIATGSDIRSRFSIRLFSLLIFRSRPADSGHYTCGTAGGQFFYGYDVDVQEAGKVSFSPELPGQWRGAAGTGPYRVFTGFWPWSVCDRCGVRGEQTRVGLCYLQTDYLYGRYRHSPPRVASCGSASVPRRFKEELQERRAELAVRRCLAACPPEPTLSPGEKSLLEFLGYGLKAPRVPVKYYTRPVGYPLVLACPNARPQHAVAWDKGRVRLYRSSYMEGLSNATRIYLDSGHHLHFRPLQLEDKGTYYCWLQGRVAAKVRLSVTMRSGVKRKLSDPESIYALKTILLSYTVFTILFVLIIVGGKCCHWIRRVCSTFSQLSRVQI